MCLCEQSLLTVSVFGVTGELQRDAQLDRLPSIEYGVNLGQGHASKNTYVFSLGLDSDGDVIDQSPIATFILIPQECSH